MPSTSPTPFLPPQLQAEAEKELNITSLAPPPRKKTSKAIIRPGTAPTKLSSPDTLPSSQPTTPLLFQPTSSTLKDQLQVRPSSALGLSRPTKEDESGDKALGEVNGQPPSKEKAEDGETIVSKEEINLGMTNGKQEVKPSPWILPIGGGSKKKEDGLAPTSIVDTSSPLSTYSQLSRDEEEIGKAQVIEVKSTGSTATPTAFSPMRGLKSPLRRPSTADSGSSYGGRVSAPPTPPPKSPRHLARLPPPVFDSSIPLPTRGAAAGTSIPTASTAPALSTISSSTQPSSIPVSASSVQPIIIPSLTLSAQTPPTESESKFRHPTLEGELQSSSSLLSNGPLSPQSPGSHSSLSSTSTHRVKRKPVPLEWKPTGGSTEPSGRRNSIQSGSYEAPSTFEGERRTSSVGVGEPSPHQRSPSGSDVMQAAQEAAMAHFAARKGSNASSPASQLAPLPSIPALPVAKRHSYTSSLPQSFSQTDQGVASQETSGPRHGEVVQNRPSTAPGGEIRGAFARITRKKKSPSVFMVEGQTFLLDSSASMNRANGLSRDSQDSTTSDADLVSQDRRSYLSGEDDLDDAEMEGGNRASIVDTLSKDDELSGSEYAPSTFEKIVESNRNRSETYTSSATSVSGSHRSPWSSFALTNRIKGNLKDQDASSSSHSEHQNAQLDRGIGGSGAADADMDEDSNPISPTTSTAPGPTLNSYNTASEGIVSDRAKSSAFNSALEPDFEAEDVIYDFSEGGTKDAPPPGSYAIHPPTVEQLIQASNCIIFDEESKPVQFGQVFNAERTLVCFLRHW